MKNLILPTVFSATAAFGCTGVSSTSMTPAPVPAIGLKNSQCGAIVESGVTVSFCFWRDAERADPTQAIFFFHGLGGSHQLDREPLKSLITMAPQLWSDQSIPVLISLSIGSSGVIRDDRASAVRRAIEKIERNLLGTAPARRHLAGVSMGGHNALRVMAVDPASFNTAALLCPALLDIDGYNPSEKAAYLARHPEVDRSFFDRAWSLYRAEFPEREGWRANNPFEFAKAGAFDGRRVLISTGRQDSLGFFEGSTRLKSALEARSIRVEWAPVDGGHCVFDRWALAGFLHEITQ